MVMSFLSFWSATALAKEGGGPIGMLERGALEDICC